MNKASVGIGISLGICFGAALGAARKKSKDRDMRHEPPDNPFHRTGLALRPREITGHG